MCAPRRLLPPTLLLLALAAAAAAQPQSGPDAVDLALAWARGGFASPVVCRFGEEVHRGLRRVLVEAGPRTSEQRVNRVQFFDLGARGAERCHDELGADEPNVIGTLLVTHSAKRPRSDTPERDLKQDLQRGPIAYEIVRGRLRVGPAGATPDALRDVDFAGGTLALGPIAPGSDDARRIADLPGSRELRLEAEARDGTRVALPLVEVGKR
jgi:hypothetical protein